MPLDDIKSRGAPILANRTLEIMRRIYNWGMSREMIEVSPCARIEKPSKEHQRDRVLTDKEIKVVWATLNDANQSFATRLKLQLLTAQRSGEVRQMRWQDIDLDKGWWTIPAEFAKNNQSHRVWLTRNARMLLKVLPSRRPR